MKYSVDYDDKRCDYCVVRWTRLSPNGFVLSGEVVFRDRDEANAIAIYEELVYAEALANEYELYNNQESEFDYV
jgi:hypothetical protein